MQRFEARGTKLDRCHSLVLIKNQAEGVDLLPEASNAFSTFVQRSFVAGGVETNGTCADWWGTWFGKERLRGALCVRSPCTSSRFCLHCMKGEQTEEAVKLFAAMPTSFVQQDVISYNATISACEKSGQWQAMCKSEAHRSVIRHSAARACEKGERLEAHQLQRGYASPEAIQQEVIGYSAAITVCEKGGQLPLTLRLLECLAPTKKRPFLVPKTTR